MLQERIPPHLHPQFGVQVKTSPILIHYSNGRNPLVGLHATRAWPRLIKNQHPTVDQASP